VDKSLSGSLALSGFRSSNSGQTFVHPLINENPLFHSMIYLMK